MFYIKIIIQKSHLPEDPPANVGATINVVIDVVVDVVVNVLVDFSDVDDIIVTEMDDVVELIGPVDIVVVMVIDKAIV